MTACCIISRAQALCAGAALAVVALPALSGADGTPFPIQATVEAMRVVAQYREAKTPPPSHQGISFGETHEYASLGTGVFLLLGAAPPPPWQVRSLTVQNASARLDSGDTLKDGGGPRGPWFEIGMAGRFNPSEATVLADIQFGAPTKAARTIGSLHASVLAVCADTTRTKSYVLTPKPVGKIHVRGLSGMADGADDMEFTLSTGHGPQAANGLCCEFRSGSLVRLKGLRVLDAAGVAMPIISSSSSYEGSGESARATVIYSYSRPVAAVALDVYDSLRAGTIDFIYTDLPLASPIAPEQRAHQATWHDAALPAPLAAPLEIMPPPVPMPQATASATASATAPAATVP